MLWFDLVWFGFFFFRWCDPQRERVWEREKRKKKKRSPTQNTTMISYKAFTKAISFVKYYFEMIRLILFIFSIFSNVTASHILFIFAGWALCLCTYNIHRLRCWHSFAVAAAVAAFFILFHARFSDYISFGCLGFFFVLLWRAFPRSAFFGKWFFFILATAHVFSIFACCGI